LGGEIKKKLNINLPISKSARQAVEKAGGQVK
jgi:ribosomal protein L15